MRYSLIVGLILLLVAGCGVEVEVDGMSYGGVDEACINGVVYYHHIQKLAPAFNTDGSIMLCNITGDRQ